MPDCRDKSDEKGCQLIEFENNYNKNIPPIGISDAGGSAPAKVDISIILMKVVEIEETDHSIHLQFQISLNWTENRVEYQNLKEKTALNSLPEYDIKSIWLPYVVYENTDQKEATRLGVEWEWPTFVAVTKNKSAGFSRSDIDKVDEAIIFEGHEHTLTMNQTYTWEFQCQYELQRYPFDSQVQIYS